MISKILDWFKQQGGQVEKDAETRLSVYPRTRFATSIFKDSRIRVGHSAFEITGANRDKESLSFTDLDYILAEKYSFDGEVLSDGPYFWITLKSYTAMHLTPSSWMDGFPALEQFLLKWPGFDINGYLDFIENGTEPVVLWKKDSPEEMTIAGTQPSGHAPSSSSSADLLQKGIWLEDRSVLIKWDTFNTLKDNPLVKTKADPFPNPSYTGEKYLISQPVIWNGLQLKELECITDGYPKDKGFDYDLPIIKFRSKVPLGNRPEAGFLKLKSHLQSYFKGWDSEEGEQKNLSCSFSKGQVKVEIRCFYGEDVKSYDNICWLDINYEPDLSRFFTDDYQLNLQLNDHISYLLLPLQVNMNEQYRLDPGSKCYARYTPDCFKNLFTADSGLLIWKDTEAGKIGFAGPDMAMIFDSNLIHKKDLTLFCGYFRDSLSEMSLELNIKGKDRAQVIAGILGFPAMSEIDLAVSKIEALLGTEISRAEDHQYY